MRAFLLDQPTRPLGAEALREFGVLHQRLPVEARAGEMARVKRERGYVEEDEVALSPDTPNLDAICAKFDKEHYHTLDEVRFVVDGEGIFDVRDKKDRWVRIEVDKGDLIIIPANTYHRFFLKDSKKIRCVRLFLNSEGWTPLYRDAAVTA
ncbi:MAG TPA: cupin domain-containing protein [Thermoanaerobaculia bacterium]|nr:cupin domain-containing protein [Thermoanaerobaculia bacterium]